MTSAEAGTAGVEETGGVPPSLDGPSVVSPGPCGFHVEVALSEAIGTVATVEWSTILAEVESAEIDFGLDVSYGLIAPVDLDEPLYRTLLLGMKPSHEYHARVVVRGDGLECPSDDFVVTTGPAPAGLLPVAVTTVDKARTAGGYLISSFFTDGPAFILDADGDYVWWGPPGQVGRAQLSFDGKYMWYGNVNQMGGNGSLASVRMDGRNAQVHAEFGDSHHDFTVLPDETIGFIQHDGESDRIMERAPNGAVRKVIDVPDAFGGTPGVTRTHTNSIHYHPGDDTYTFSDLLKDAYVKVKRTGEVVWVLGGTKSEFTGDTTWRRQHGHDLIASDRLLFFNNGPDLMPATVIELSLDLDQLTATRVWSYPGADRQAPIYGDVQRLDNGNTLVTYSSVGVIEEVTPDGEVVEMLEWMMGGTLGYSMKRASLYGPPPIR